MIARIFQGALVLILGLVLIIYRREIYNYIGEMDFASKLFGGTGGTMIFLVLFGTFLVFVGIAIIFRGTDMIFDFIRILFGR